MSFEIFVEPELEVLNNVESAEEWQNICNELGLSGQRSLTENSPSMQAPPYMAIDDKTQRIIRALCPCKSEVDRYDGSTIPLEVLREIKKAKENGWFKKIFIFSDDKTPDPFVVGMLYSEYEWNAKYMLIARWGAELLPFELLEEKAIDRLAIAAKDALACMKSYVDNGLADIHHFVQKHLCGYEAPSFKFKIGNIYGSGSLPF